MFVDCTRRLTRKEWLKYKSRLEATEITSCRIQNLFSVHEPDGEIRLVVLVAFSGINYRHLITIKLTSVRPLMGSFIKGDYGNIYNGRLWKYL